MHNHIPEGPRPLTLATVAVVVALVFAALATNHRPPKAFDRTASATAPGQTLEIRNETAP